MAGAGSTSSHPCYGQSAPRQPSPLARHHSSSSTGRKQFSPPSSSMVPHGSSPSTRLTRTTCGRTTYCSSRRRVAKPPSARHGTSKGCAATTAATSAPAPLKLVTSSFEEFSPEKASTSSHPCGRGRSGLCTSHGLERHACKRRTVSRCRTRGTSSTSANSTRDHHGGNYLREPRGLINLKRHRDSLSARIS